MRVFIVSRTDHSKWADPFDKLAEMGRIAEKKSVYKAHTHHQEFVQTERPVIWPPFTSREDATGMLEVHVKERLTSGAILYRDITLDHRPNDPVFQDSEFIKKGSGSLHAASILDLPSVVREVEIIIQQNHRSIYRITRHPVIMDPIFRSYHDWHIHSREQIDVVIDADMQPFPLVVHKLSDKDIQGIE